MIGRRTLLLAMTALALGGTAAFAQSAPLNPNTATPAQLAAVPGLTPALASSIVQQRPFASIVEFNTLIRKTLSEAQAKTVYEQLFISVNLNSGTREQIALIPGMSTRMIREFQEYRPYASLEMFNREIGKYVNATEVARLRRYVTI